MSSKTKKRSGAPVAAVAPTTPSKKPRLVHRESSPEIVEIQSPVKKTGTLPKKGQSDQTTTPVKQTVKTPAKRDSNKSASPAKQKVSDSAKVPGSAKGEPMQRAIVQDTPTRSPSTRSRRLTEKALHSLVAFQTSMEGPPGTETDADKETPNKKDKKSVVHNPSPGPKTPVKTPTVSDGSSLDGFLVPDDHVSELSDPESEVEAEENDSIANVAELSSDEDVDVADDHIQSAEVKTPVPRESVIGKDRRKTAGPDSSSNAHSADEGDDETEHDDDDDDDDDEKLHTDTSVMHSGFQDPLEREMRLYAALPLLRTSATVDPFKWYTYKIGIDIAHFASSTNKFSSVYRHYTSLVQRSLVCGLSFLRTGPYVNLSRVDPSTLTAADNRVCDKTTRKTVACVMTGFVSNWDLDTAMERPNSRNPEQPLRVHQVTIVPFTQFFRREMAVWGEILGFTRITGTIFVEGMGFTTRSEQGDGQTSQNATTSVSSAPPSPARTPSRAPTRSRVAASGVPATRVGALVRPTVVSSIPSSLSFTDEIPLYDGRPGMKYADRGFEFTDDDFQTLPTWPRFQTLAALTDAAAAIGYSVNTYSTRDGFSYLSTNILFVIVLGLYSDADAS